MKKKLFVCTKPYQYIIARNLKDSLENSSDDIIILNHFPDAKYFSESIKQTNVWNNVRLIDDFEITSKQSNSGIIERIKIYIFWKKAAELLYIPNISDYDELYIAHDTVFYEYVLLQHFKSQNKPIFLFEEGTGNYVNNNNHRNIFKKILRKYSSFLGFPGDYIGRNKYIEKVYLLYPEIILNKRKNPLKRKVIGIPKSLKDFLVSNNIVEEFMIVYPELKKLKQEISGYQKVNIYLLQPFTDITSSNEKMRNFIKKYVPNVSGGKEINIIKQHPGDNNNISHDKDFLLFPRQVPIELLTMVLKVEFKDINVYTFGSTAAISLMKIFESAKVHLIVEDEQKYFVSLVEEFGLKINKV